ncbi:MAG: hypothetical protein LIP12_13235 [Clostridiales bacterium]|nr:hypothetical protein [Clostridiales bacterium]
MRKKAISEFIKKNTSEYIDADKAEAMSLEAKKIMDTGVKMKDAYHVACAVFASCDYFLTTDIRLLKYKTDRIKLMNPIEFINELETER